MTQSGQNENDSLFRIMVATDNHLGFLEHDQIRGDDSFYAFEEICKVSKSENVDFLLLGGDLFHHHNPSKKTIIRASNILQNHVYGQKNHKFDVFCYHPNFKNENLSIELPIFIIHGNHDDPSGFENFSSIDIFSNKEVNYFGKVNNYEEFDLYPILLVKGSTKIALYGIGNIKDERLYLALQNKKVNFHRPDDYKSWFNILIVHQNRFKGHNTGKNRKNYLPESFIPSFFDFVIWGHEHESFTEPHYNSEVGFHVYQPGSSVVTSLIQAESKQKHIGLLEVFGDKFRVLPIRLQTVRPFIYQTFELKNHAGRINTNEDIEKIIEERIEEMLREAKEQYPMSPLVPILRMKVEFSGYMMIRTNFIVSKYGGKIANLNDVIQFYKKGDIFRLKRNPHNDCEMEMENVSTALNIEDEMNEDDEVRKFINTNVSQYLADKNKKSILNPDLFTDSLEKNVNGHEKKSLDLLFRSLHEHSLTFCDYNSSTLKELAPLDNPKKEFSQFVQDVVDISEVNNQLLNNNMVQVSNNNRAKKSGANAGGGNNNNNNINNNNNNINNIASNNINAINNNTSANDIINNILTNNTNQVNNIPNNFKLSKANNFEEEKREKKNVVYKGNKNLKDMLSRSNTTSQVSSPKSSSGGEGFFAQFAKQKPLICIEERDEFDEEPMNKPNNAKKRKNYKFEEKIDPDLNKKRKSQFK
jgi:double-strand break repair protein MRE11